MEIIRGDVAIVLTPEETEAAYRERLRDYRRIDARRQIVAYAGIDPDAHSEVECRENAKKFAFVYGIDPHDLVEGKSERALKLIDGIVDAFEDHEDPGIPVNEQWRTAILRALPHP